jgi:hypothetical protein
MVERDFREGRLGFDEAGRVEIAGTAAAEGENPLALYVQQLRKVCPPQLIKSRVMPGSDTGGDRGAGGGGSLVEQFLAQQQARGALVVNPLMPKAPGNPLAAEPSRYTTQAEIEAMLPSKEALVARLAALERGAGASE